MRRPLKRAGSTETAATLPASASAPSTPKAPTIPSQPTDLRDLVGWKAVVLRDEITGARVFEFTMPDEIGNDVTCEIPMHLTEAQMVMQLRAYGDLPTFPATAALAVRKLTSQARVSVFTKVRTPGWKGMSGEGSMPNAFILARQTIPADCKFRWPSKSASRLGETRGTLATWNAAVSPLAKQSNPVAFAICAALAAALVRFADLTESAVFNFVGPSSAGKSSIAKLAQTVLGPPASIQSWDFKDRALEEAAALHNDCPLIMDAAERLKQADLRLFMTRVVHMLPDGKGMVRSNSVNDTLPNLAWKNIILSTSNFTGREMAGAAAAWNDQEAVRFIDIPINDADMGGIFDRVTSGDDLRAHTARLVAQTALVMDKNYGTLWPCYIAHLMTLDLNSVIARHIADYLTYCEIGSSVEERIAQKFGLCFAAGMIAQSAGLLTWAPMRVRNAVRTMHRRAANLRSRPSATLIDALKVIRDNMHGPMVRDLTVNGVVRIASSTSWWGIKTTYKQRLTLGIRRDDLLARFPPSTVNALNSWFKSSGILIGDGRKGTQIRMDLTIGSNRWMKPRFILLDYEKLLAAEME
ncbi:DUF927 domain-containing protein [Tardiphaga sp. OK246]|uniref:DUF927 domain-containing protein n=1 Tax=Tardiphaga sp. OK246 TaxID=1855307 RepID=UPI001595BE27|nr:DUF927 domain-containing protein [Tardiphaga sp. OK246]